MKRAYRIVMSMAAVGVLNMSVLAQGASGPGQATQEEAKEGQERVAMDSARQKLREQVLATPISERLSVGDVLRDKDELGQLDKELAGVRPVGGVRWIDEKNCQVKLELPGDRVEQLLGKALGKSATRPAGSLADVRNAIRKSTFTSYGSTMMQPEKVAGARSKLIPQQPPDWVQTSLASQAWVRSAGSPLLTAQAAERKARQSMRERVGALVLGYSTTIEQAGKNDPEIATAADRAVSLARVRRTDYGSDGSATVHIELNLQSLWDELAK